MQQPVHLLSPVRTAFGIYEENLHAPGEDVLVDPGFPPGTRDLLGVEPSGLRGDVREELQEPGRQIRAPGVAEEDEHLLATAERLPDPVGEPGLFGVSQAAGNASPVAINSPSSSSG
jgi:hypothetical protein